MKSKSKLALVLMGGAAVLALTVGLAAFGFTSTARANDAIGQPEISHRSGPQPFPGMAGQEDTFLADVLGISVEELQSAQTAAYEAAIDQALSDGLITLAQADQLKNGTGLGRGERGFAAGFVFGPDSEIDLTSLLADALSISVDELSAAREQAQSARIAQAVADGVITQEKADQMAARQALQAYIDPQAIMAEALGISEDTLQTYRDEGLSLIDILGQVGLTPSEFVGAQQAAYEAVLQQAVLDGVITQEQADQATLAAALGRFGAHGGRGGFGIRPERGLFPGMQHMPTTPAATDTSL
jgi:hypothetical protein